MKQRLHLLILPLLAVLLLPGGMAGSLCGAWAADCCPGEPGDECCRAEVEAAGDWAVCGPCQTMAAAHRAPAPGASGAAIAGGPDGQAVAGAAPRAPRLPVSAPPALSLSPHISTTVLLS